MTENNITLKKIAELLKLNKKFVFICHVRPDGDTLACAFALKNVLEDMGKKVTVFSSDPVSDRLSFLCDTDVLLPNQYPTGYRPDLTVTLDVASTSMLGKCAPLLSVGESLKIDHHTGEDNFATYNYSDPASASCSEIIYDIINLMGQPMSDKTCALLYAGISFDTGCFKHSNVTESTHIKAAELIKRDIDPSRINQKLFGNKTQKEITALKTSYNSLTYYHNGKIAVVCIDNKVKKEKDLTDDDLADLAQIPFEIDGVVLGITITEKSDEPNHFKVSMRSEIGTNAANICKKLGGGGHICAAGALVTANTGEEAIKKVLDAAYEEFN